MSTIDISEPVKQISRLLGLEPRDVAHLDIRPSRLTAITLKRNEHGSPYLEDGEVQTETHEFEITT